jgi:uncharacterized protein (TIGR02145 family)
MKENLNYPVDSSWCHSNNNPDTCNKYGRLYNWNAAMQGASSSNMYPSSQRGVCPTGWHLPSHAEWDTLVARAGGFYVAGKALKSTSGWNDYQGASGNGTDAYGFSALPGGGRYSDGDFHSAGHGGYWWAATEHGSGYAYNRRIDHYNDHAYEYYNDKGYGFSVRCVQD